ncbi:MAG TPA: M13 family metallopeptidase [Gemmatimonadaceae bacterium]|nr:M13 family metallopeptidase [Gemmatimonadaceae bacterium]
MFPRILRLASIIFLSPVLWAPFTVSRGQTADDRASRVESAVDTTVRPGDDFFAYANGGWLKATGIPAGRDNWGARDEINALTRERVARLFDDASAGTPHSLARKVADFRAAYLNEANIEALGLTPLRPFLDEIDRVQNPTALARVLGRGMRADVDPLNFGVYNSATPLGLSVERSTHGEKNYVAFLLQGGLGLPGREQYLSGDASAEELRAKYQRYIAGMFSQAGFDRPRERGEAVMMLEIAIARSHATSEQSASDHNADNIWTRADFTSRAPGMDWSAFFDAAGLGREHSFVAWQPTAITGLSALISSQPLEVWKDYLRFHLLDRYADVLPGSFAAGALAMRTAAGEAPPSSRTQRALDVTQSSMSEAIGRMYSERYFTADQKARVLGVVSNVATAFARRVEGSTWMSAATRAMALSKLKKLYIGVGYPDRWQDYSDLVVDVRNPIANLRSVAERDRRRAVARIGRPIDRSEWLIAPHGASAILVFEQNAYDFSAGLLQPPKFDPAASDAATYGAIGAIIGHDITHFVDELGAGYDLDGRSRRWWSSDDSARFESLAKPLVDQFSGYHPFADVAVDGKRSEVENIADLGGLSAAFDAYRSTLGDKAADTSYVHRLDREFFVAFAQSWRAMTNEAGIRKQASGDHAPDRYRVSTVRNLDAWYDAFDVRPGQTLYLEPGARVRIW